MGTCHIVVQGSTERLLTQYAEQYETKEFLHGDPSWFMHQVTGATNQETMAFIASCLSYGSRKQFMPKISHLLECSEGEVAKWVATGLFEKIIPADSSRCYYRLYSYMHLNAMLRAYRQLMHNYGSMGQYVCANANTGIEAVRAITAYFASHQGGPMVPKDTQSACKRVCMFLRWMVRDHSPVDLGLWSHGIDKRTLIMPLDTHVMQQACRLGLARSRQASMAAAQRLTSIMATIFPNDPLRADFALFGYGVNHVNYAG